MIETILIIIIAGIIFYWVKKVPFHFEEEKVSGEEKENFTKEEIPEHIDPEEMLEWARKLISKNKLDQAESLLFELLKIKEDPAYLITLGSLYLAKEDYHKAAEVLEKVEDKEPENASLLNNLGFSYFKIGIWDKAAEYYEKALKIEPKASRYINLALVYREKEDIDNQIKSIKKAIKLDPKIEYQEALGEILLEHQRLKEAKEVFEKILSKFPRNKTATKGLEECELMSGEEIPVEKSEEKEEEPIDKQKEEEDLKETLE